MTGGLYGQDTLEGAADGGSADSDNFLYAKNDSDILYFSGDDSYYYGTGNNTFVYNANPGDNIIIFQDGIEVNGGSLQAGTWNPNGGAPDETYVNGTYHPFGAISGIGQVVIDDTGTCNARLRKRQIYLGTLVSCGAHHKR